MAVDVSPPQQHQPPPASDDRGRYAALPVKTTGLPAPPLPRRSRRHRPRRYLRTLGVALLWAVLLGAAALGALGTALFWFSDAFDDALIDNLVLRNGTPAFEMWRRPPVVPHIRVWLFNYTNAEQVQSEGVRPRVQEVGPYTFRQLMEKVDVAFEGADAVRFRESTQFEPLPDESADLDGEPVTVVSIPLLSASSVLRDASYWKQMAMQLALKAVSPRPFLRFPPRDFLFGYKEALTELAKAFAIVDVDPQSLKLGILESRAGVSPDEMEVETGAGDRERLGLVRRVGDRSRLAVWGATPCAAIDGSDGSLFPPRAVHRRRRLHLFSTDMCRKIPLDFVRTDTFDGLEALVYAPPPNVFGTPSENPDNACFCRKRTGEEGEDGEDGEEEVEVEEVGEDVGEGECPGQEIGGVFDVGACNFNAPVLVSFPHFLGGDERLRTFTDGLRPDPDKHSMAFYLHPLLGVPMGATTRFQMNVKVRKTDKISSIDFLQEGAILPVAWIEIKSDSLPDEIRELLSSATTTTTSIRLTLMYGSLTLLVVSLVTILYCCWTRVGRWRKGHTEDVQVLQPL